MSSLRAAAWGFPGAIPRPQKRKPMESFRLFSCLGSGEGKKRLRLVLHDWLESGGVDMTQARGAREGFLRQAGLLGEIDGGASIVVSHGADLARAALHIAAEDDALASHSSLALPIDSFVRTLDDLSMAFCSLSSPPSHAPPQLFLQNLNRFLYAHKGFRRTEMMSDSRALYLHSALTCRLGSAAMLSLIYSEMLKTLRVCGFLDFDVEIYHPCESNVLPSGYQKQKSKLSDQPHILTAKSLLVEILRNLKDAFWPFQYDSSSSLFLSAAQAASHVFEPIISGESHSKPYAQQRLECGLWANTCFGNMRCALAACERLIILGTDLEELRDYAVLLYHCGYYEDCLEYLKSYQTARMASPEISDEIEDAVKILEARVNLILAEKGWSKQSIQGSFWGNRAELCRCPGACQTET